MRNESDVMKIARTPLHWLLAGDTVLCYWKLLK